MRNLSLPFSAGLMLFILLIVGCGGQTTVLKAPVEVSTKPTYSKRVAIFPLADYSQRKPFIESYVAPNLLIIEEITQNLVGQGFDVSIQEDVNEVLVSEKILLPLPVRVPSQIQELLKQLSKTQKDAYGRWQGVNFNLPHDDEIQSAKRKKTREDLKKELEKNLSSPPPGVKGLDGGTVQKLARGLNVDIIFRGRILEYGFKTKDTLNPFKGAGLLTFLIDEPKRFFFGVSSREKYDTLELVRDAVESAVMGGAMGAALGAAVDGGDGAGPGAIIGGGLGLLRTGKKHPVESSVMHIRLYAQDGKTGKIIWTNAIEVERVTESRFALEESHPKVLLDKLTREGTKLLVDDFIEFMKPKVSAKLEKMPDGVKFPEGFKKKIRYDEPKQLLFFKGTMTKEEKDELIRLSTDDKYIKAIEALFQKSRTVN